MQLVNILGILVAVLSFKGEARLSKSDPLTTTSLPEMERCLVCTAFPK